VPERLDGIRDNLGATGEERSQRTDCASKETQADRQEPGRIGLKMRFTMYRYAVAKAIGTK
jgi:hypothetical protein